MLVIQDLDGATVERAGALVAREHAAARQARPELPAGFGSAGFCTAALQRLRDSGHHGLVATGAGRTAAVMTAAVRQHPAGGRYARLPAEGFAADPDLGDPTGVLAAVFGDLAAHAGPHAAGKHDQSARITDTAGGDATVSPQLAVRRIVATRQRHPAAVPRSPGPSSSGPRQTRILVGRP